MPKPILPVWPGETVHILAGGPSLADKDFSKFAGRRVIAINKSGFDWPDADVLFFADGRFLSHYLRQVLAFKNEIITVREGRSGERFHQVRKVPNPIRKGVHPSLSLERDAVAMDRTSLQGAINIAVHKGAAEIILHGADMKRGPNGESHHHDPYPDGWDFSKEWPANMIADLACAVRPLADLGIRVRNANPESGLPHWPKCTFEEAFE